MSWDQKRKPHLDSAYLLIKTLWVEFTNLLLKQAPIVTARVAKPLL